MKRLFLNLLIFIFIFYVIEPCLKGLSWLFFDANSFITFSLPYLDVSKFILYGIVIVAGLYYLLIFSRFGKITLAGKLTFPILLFVLFGGFLLTFVNFISTNEVGVTQQKLWGSEQRKWAEVSYITTSAEVKNNMRNGLMRQHLSLEYRVHFKDGSSVNVWDNINSLKALNDFVKKQGIKIKHKQVDKEIRDNVDRYIEGDKDIAKEILSIP